MAVLLENLVRQGTALRKLMLQRQVLDGLLLLTSRVDELSILPILNKYFDFSTKQGFMDEFKIIRSNKVQIRSYLRTDKN